MSYNLSEWNFGHLGDYRFLDHCSCILLASEGKIAMDYSNYGLVVVKCFIPIGFSQLFRNISRIFCAVSRSIAVGLIFYGIKRKNQYMVLPHVILQLISILGLFVHALIIFLSALFAGAYSAFTDKTKVIIFILKNLYIIKNL